MVVQNQVLPIYFNYIFKYIAKHGLELKGTRKGWFLELA